MVSGGAGLFAHPEKAPHAHFLAWGPFSRPVQILSVWALGQREEKTFLRMHKTT